MPSVFKNVAKKPIQSNSHNRYTYKVSFSIQTNLGKIVTAYNEGQCEINAGHSWMSGDEIFWQKDDEKVITCNNKDCFENQGGKAEGEIEVKQEQATKPKTIDKHTSLPTPTEIQENDAEIHGGGQGEDESPKSSDEHHDTGAVKLKVKTMDVVDIAAEKMLLEFTTYAKEIKVIETAIIGVFGEEAPGQKIGMITRMLWEYKCKKL